MKNLKIISLILIVILALVMGCEETSIEPSFRLANEASFKVNQLYTSGDGQYTLKITKVEDSRCALGHICVWQGELTVFGEWTDGVKKSNFEIHSVLADARIQPDGFVIDIVDVLPYPVAGVDTNPNQLVVTLIIHKNELK